MNSQLTLGISLRDSTTFENFYANGNEEVLACLQDIVAGNCKSFVYICGSESSGRSHLLQACCHEMGQLQKTSVYLPLKELKAMTPDVLENLDQVDFMAIDDVDCIAGDATWEEAIFHMYNRMQDKRLVIAGSLPPAQLPIKLQDLRSRLGAGITYQVRTLDEEGLLAALQLRAKRRSLLLPDNVALFIVRRFPRNMTELFNVFEKLDRASWEAQRKLTIPFVKEVLGV